MMKNIVRYSRNDQFLVASIGSENVVLFCPSDPDNYFGIKNEAKDIWEMLENPMTLVEIVDQLAAQYKAPRHVISGDVEVFLNELISENLIEIA